LLARQEQDGQQIQLNQNQPFSQRLFFMNFIGNTNAPWMPPPTNAGNSPIDTIEFIYPCSSSNSWPG